jgi:type 1 fimbria pilin
MKSTFLLATLFAALPLLFATPASAQADTKWILDQSTLTYHMSHPMHEVNGVSRAAKGEGVCHAGQCEFLIAAPVKSFDSGDSNRDLHMIEATRGAQFPMVIVSTHFTEPTANATIVDADLEVQFAGQTVPATCSDFKINRPSFLTVPIKNEIPVKVEMTWRPQ